MNSCIDFSAALAPSAPRLRHAFRAPRAVLSARDLAEVRPVLDAVFAAAQAGAWCVGYVRYEAARAFDAAFQVHPSQGPLAWFAVYDEALPWPGEAAADSADGAHVEWTSGPSRAEFDAALNRIHQAIGDGELYQVNYTQPLDVQYQGDAATLYRRIAARNPVAHGAYIEDGARTVLSFSPELFVTRRGARLTTRPRKGTAPRHPDPAEDQRLGQALLASDKNRAENLMIVDLLRNDLGRLAAIPRSGP